MSSFYHFCIIGVERQHNCVTLEESENQYKNSCKHCTGRYGYNNCCSRCPIEAAYHEKQRIIKELREAEIERLLRKAKREAELASIESEMETIYHAYNAILDDYNERLDELTRRYVFLKYGDIWRKAK